MTNTRDMVLIRGGTFVMGSDEFYPDERPAHERKVESFFIDRYEVTNARYGEFVDATGYVTVAERPMDPAAYPGADPADLVPGSMVFTPTAGPTDLRNWRITVVSVVIIVVMASGFARGRARRRRAG